MLLTNATRILTNQARRNAIAKLSSRTFAVAASTQLQSAPSVVVASRENLGSSNLGWLAAAAAVAGLVATKDEKVDCCGIAGVVGKKGDAR